MTSHTPAPWGISSQSSKIIKQYDALGETNVIIGSASSYPQSGFFPSDELAVKNALLMAAAPELLEALSDMLGGWKYIRSTHGDLYGVGWDRAQDKADAAIAKATGAA